MQSPDTWSEPVPVINAVPDVQSRARLAGYDPAVLENACVIVVGAGALGQNVAMDLALSGVGELRIVDGDVFEPHNRSRSPLHPRRGSYGPDERLPKASCVGCELTRIHIDQNACIRVADTWIEELGLGAFDGVDVIAACVDSLLARSYLARVAMVLNIPIVDGGFSGANLGMGVYPRSGEPSDAPCWSCGGQPLAGAFSCESYARYAQAAGVVPAIQSGAAALGAMCAEAAVNLLHHRETEARRVSFDLRSGKSRTSRPQPDPECARSHRRLPEALDIGLSSAATVTDVLALLGEPDVRLFPSDVYVERANCPEPGCEATCEVGAPSHRWRRDARCTECGGPWTRAARQIPSPDIIDAGLAIEDEQSGLTLRRLGVRPGDVVELVGSTHAAIRIAGGAEDLFLPSGENYGDETGRDGSS
jgi:hypothetical protein